LLPGLIRAAERNFNRGSGSIALFELGKVFSGDNVEETVNLALILSGERQAKTWNQPALNYDLFDLKGILESAFRQKLTLRRIDSTELAPLLCDIIGAGERTVGRIAQLNPALGKEMGARTVLVAAEVNLDLKGAKSFHYKPLDRFPGISRDVAFIAPLNLKYQEVRDTILSAGEDLLVDVRLFDRFVDPTGDKVAADKKSMACSLTYRSSERTLTHEEVGLAHDRLKALLVKRLGVTLRE
jgi:phenylalanyl-tRNA synthetase beta chain